MASRMLHVVLMDYKVIGEEILWNSKHWVLFINNMKHWVLIMWTNKLYQALGTPSMNKAIMMESTGCWWLSMSLFGDGIETHLKQGFQTHATAEMQTWSLMVGHCKSAMNSTNFPFWSAVAKQFMVPAPWPNSVLTSGQQCHRNTWAYFAPLSYEINIVAQYVWVSLSFSFLVHVSCFP